MSRIAIGLLSFSAAFAAVGAYRNDYEYWSTVCCASCQFVKRRDVEICTSLCRKCVTPRLRIRNLLPSFSRANLLDDFDRFQRDVDSPLEPAVLPSDPYDSPEPYDSPDPSFPNYDPYPSDGGYDFDIDPEEDEYRGGLRGRRGRVGRFGRRAGGVVDRTRKSLRGGGRGGLLSGEGDVLEEILGGRRGRKLGDRLDLPASSGKRLGDRNRREGRGSRGGGLGDLFADVGGFLEGDSFLGDRPVKSLTDREPKSLRGGLRSGRGEGRALDDYSVFGVPGHVRPSDDEGRQLGERRNGALLEEFLRRRENRGEASEQYGEQPVDQWGLELEGLGIEEGMTLEELWREMYGDEGEPFEDTNKVDFAEFIRREMRLRGRNSEGAIGGDRRKLGEVDEVEEGRLSVGDLLDEFLSRRGGRVGNDESEEDDGEGLLRNLDERAPCTDDDFPCDVESIRPIREEGLLSGNLMREARTGRELGGYWFGPHLHRTSGVYPRFNTKLGNMKNTLYKPTGAYIQPIRHTGWTAGGYYQRPSYH